MGLHDVAAYQRMAKGFLKQGLHLLSGLNIPNEKPGEPLLEWAAVVRSALPGVDLCLHYSLKHQRTRGDPVSAFETFCQQAADLGVARVLLVSGPNGPKLDAVGMLERMAHHPAPGRLRLGVAFNATLLSEADREYERGRLARKLRTQLVQDVWLNTGSDTELLAIGSAAARGAAAEHLPNPQGVQLFGSVFLPNEAQLVQMRERPWNGVHFGADYLSSLGGMTKGTEDVLRVYGAQGVEPIVESKVRTAEDLGKLERLLQSYTFTPFVPSPAADVAPLEAAAPAEVAHALAEVAQAKVAETASPEAAIDGTCSQAAAVSPQKARRRWGSKTPVA